MITVITSTNIIICWLLNFSYTESNDATLADAKFKERQAVARQALKERIHKNKEQILKKRPQMCKNLSCIRSIMLRDC